MMRLPRVVYRVEPAIQHSRTATYLQDELARLQLHHIHYAPYHG